MKICTSMRCTVVGYAAQKLPASVSLIAHIKARFSRVLTLNKMLAVRGVPSLDHDVRASPRNNKWNARAIKQTDGYPCLSSEAPVSIVSSSLGTNAYWLPRWLLWRCWIIRPLWTILVLPITSQEGDGEGLKVDVMITTDMQARFFMTAAVQRPRQPLYCMMWWGARTILL